MSGVNKQQPGSEDGRREDTGAGGYNESFSDKRSLKPWKRNSTGKGSNTISRSSGAKINDSFAST